MLRLQRAGDPMQVPHLVPLVHRKRNGFFQTIEGRTRRRDEGLHLEILRRQQSTSYIAKVNAFIPLIEVVGFEFIRDRSGRDQTSLH